MMRAINPIYHHSNDMLIKELEWIQKAKQNPQHFAPLYMKYNEQIYRYVFIRIKDLQIADDITSQIFLKAMNSIKRYEFRGIPLASWLYRIAMSEINQYFRDAKKRNEVEISDAEISTFMDVFKDESVVIDKQKLNRALKELNVNDLELIKLRFYEDRPFKEIGEMLEIKENNAKVKTFRAVEKLKKNFKKL